MPSSLCPSHPPFPARVSGPVLNPRIPAPVPAPRCSLPVKPAAVFPWFPGIIRSSWKVSGCVRPGSAAAPVSKELAAIALRGIEVRGE